MPVLLQVVGDEGAAVLVGLASDPDVFRSRAGCLRHLGRHPEVGSSSLHESLVTKAPQCYIRDEMALLDPIEREHVFEWELGVLHEQSRVALVDYAPINGQLHFSGIAQVVVGQGEVSVGLRAVHPLDPVSEMVDHVQLCHRLDKGRIPVAPGHVPLQRVLVGDALEEGPDAGELESVWVFRDADSRVLRVVLVRYAVVHGLEHAALVVLLDLPLDQLARGQEPDLDVADPRVESCRGEDEGDTEVLVGVLLPDELPGELGHEGREQEGRLRFTEKEDAGARDAALRDEAGVPEKLLVGPGLDCLGGDARGVVLGEAPPGDGDCLRREVGELCVFDDLCSPVHQMTLGADCIDLVESKGLRVLSSAAVPVPFPCNRYSLWGGGNFEHEDPSVRMRNRPDASEGGAWIGVVIYLTLEGIDAPRVGTVPCSDNRPGLVLDPEHQPSGFQVGEVGLVA